MGLLYKCNPERNKTCRKTECYIHGGDCYCTTHIEYSLSPYVSVPYTPPVEEPKKKSKRKVSNKNDE